jgi:hypothetical protein
MLADFALCDSAADVQKLAVDSRSGALLVGSPDSCGGSLPGVLGTPAGPADDGFGSTITRDDRPAEHRREILPETRRCVASSRGRKGVVRRSTSS